MDHLVAIDRFAHDEEAESEGTDHWSDDLVAEQEGVFLDPVYTAKSFAAIPALVADGTIPQGARVCYVHTGGLAALFAYHGIMTNQA